MKQSLLDDLPHDLIDILTRNYQIGEFTIASGVTAGALVYSLDPGSLFTDILNIANKLDGFLCYHADFEFEIRWNVEPQAVGAVSLLQHYPQAKSNAERESYQSSQVCWSTLGTHVNLLTETASKFCIRYLSTSMAFSQNSFVDVSEVGYWPRFDIKVWSPYISPTNTDLKIAVYARMKNVVPMIPTILAIDAPTNMQEFKEFYAMIRKKAGYKITDFDKKEMIKILQTKLESLELDAQTGADEELKKEKGFVFSETVTKANHFVQSLPGISYINDIKEVSAQVLPKIADTARYFGYSKPEEHRGPDQVEQQNAKCMNNTDGFVNSYNLANSCHQRRAVAALAKDSINELGIAHFASRPSYFTRFRIGRTTPPNSIVYKTNVSPFRMSDGTGSTFIPTTVAFPSLFFEHWRGDLNYRLRIIGNRFINFNLLVGFVPGANQDAINNDTDLSNIYNVIYDGTDLSTIDYRVEYKSINPWKKTYSNYRTFTNPATSEEIVGTFVVKLINAFTSSSSTVDSVDITLEVFGGENLEFNVLHNVPYNFRPPTSMVLDAQTNADPTARSTDDRSVDGIIHKEQPTSLIDAMTFGQKIASFKEILNVESFTYSRPLVTPPTDGFGDIFGIWPYSIIRPNDRAVVQGTEDRGYNYLTLICQPWAFVSGEVLMTFFVHKLNDNISLDHIKYDPWLTANQIIDNPSLADQETISLSSAQPQTASYMQNLGSNVVIQNTLQARKVVRVPAFTDRPIWLRHHSDASYIEAVRSHEQPPGVVFYGRPYNTLNGVTDNTPVSVWMRGADNMMFHFFNGLTTMYYNPVFTANEPVPIPEAP